MTSIYRDAMSRDFGAKVITDECGSKRLVALDASPLPSLDQYRYQVRKALGQDEIDRVRWGPTRHRRRNAQYRGKFSSAVSNVYERVEADAYYCEDRPTGYDGQPTQNLCVARAVDTASGMRLDRK